MKKFIALILFLMLVQASNAQDFSVGVSPLIVNIGELEKGSTSPIKFNLITQSSEPFSIYLDPEEGRIDFFNKVGYTNLVFNYSEQKVASWIRLLDNPVEALAVDPAKPNARSTMEVSALLEIPSDAESGYHVINIKPEPEIPAGGAGEVGTSIIGIVSVNVLFRVQGNVIRNGKILDVVQVPSGKGIAFKTYFKNTGTTTISASASQKIYDSDSEIAEASSTGAVLAPQETKDFLVTFDTNEIDIGKDYTIFTTVDYFTGKTYMNSTMRIEAVPYIPPGTKEIAVPLWVFIVLFVIVLVVVYRWIRQ
jgi:hypothetical protein